MFLAIANELFVCAPAICFVRRVPGPLEQLQVYFAGRSDPLLVSGEKAEAIKNNVFQIFVRLSADLHINPSMLIFFKKTIGNLYTLEFAGQSLELTEFESKEFYHKVMNPSRIVV